MSSSEVYFDSQDVRLTGTLVVPDNVAATAAVLCITGGGEEHCDHYYREFMDYLAEEAGFASLAFNARGVGESGGVFQVKREGDNPDGLPVNSQASRVVDAMHAIDFLKRDLWIEDDKRIAVFGGSMGGDIAANIPDIDRYGALVLRAPAAYPVEIHTLPYGRIGETVQMLGGEAASLQSTNFDTIKGLDIPQMLIYSRGDKVIPWSIQLRYVEAVTSAGGQAFFVGDTETGHSYLNHQPEDVEARSVDAWAKEDTFRYATDFLLRHLVSR